MNIEYVVFCSKNNNYYVAKTLYWILIDYISQKKTKHYLFEISFTYIFGAKYSEQNESRTSVLHMVFFQFSLRLICKIKLNDTVKYSSSENIMSFQ